MPEATYGDMLSFFPELLRPYSIWVRHPRIGAGFADKLKYGDDVDGWVNYSKGGKQSVITNAKTEDQQAAFITFSTIPDGDISQGLYIWDSGSWYTFMSDNTFQREGGFSEYALQLVTGNNGKQRPHHGVNVAPK